MRQFRTPDGLRYRPCAAADAAAVHDARRNRAAVDPTFREVVDAVSAQIVVDDALGGEGYLELSAGVRVLVAVEGVHVVGLVTATITEGAAAWTAEVDAWACPVICHPERPLDFVGDALSWLRNIGVVSATTRAHLRAQEGAPARTVEVVVDPIPEHPLGLPRPLVYDLSP